MCVVTVLGVSVNHSNLSVLIVVFRQRVCWKKYFGCSRVNLDADQGGNQYFMSPALSAAITGSSQEHHWSRVSAPSCLNSRWN